MKRRVPKGQRKRVIKNILNLYGNRCCWCSKPMEIPEPKQTPENYLEMVSIEHHFAKERKDIFNENLWMLAHVKCNK